MDRDRRFDEEQTTCKRYWASWVNLIHKVGAPRLYRRRLYSEFWPHWRTRHAFLMRSAAIRPSLLRHWLDHSCVTNDDQDNIENRWRNEEVNRCLFKCLKVSWFFYSKYVYVKQESWDHAAIFFRICTRPIRTRTWRWRGTRGRGSRTRNSASTTSWRKTMARRRGAAPRSRSKTGMAIQAINRDIQNRIKYKELCCTAESIMKGSCWNSKPQFGKR